jgi:hypothetical protein
LCHQSTYARSARLATAKGMSTVEYIKRVGGWIVLGVGIEVDASNVDANGKTRLDSRDEPQGDLACERTKRARDDRDRYKSSRIMVMSKGGLAQIYRSRAKDHLEKAKLLLRENNVELTFVCLKLRQCIEALSYGWLAVYRHELSKSAMLSWTPRKVLDELEAVDPLANTSRTISIGIPVDNGESEIITVSGDDRRFGPKWASKAFNKLSNILHEPTPKMLDSRGELSPEEIRARCAAYIEVLGEIFETPLWHFVSGRFAEFKCDCGFLIKRRVEVIKVGSAFECGECGRIHDVISKEGGEIGVQLRMAQWVCNGCNTENQLEAHELEEGKTINCRNCQAPITIGKAWVFS